MGNPRVCFSDSSTAANPGGEPLYRESLLQGQRKAAGCSFIESVAAHGYDTSSDDGFGTLQPK